MPKRRLPLRKASRWSDCAFGTTSPATSLVAAAARVRRRRAGLHRIPAGIAQGELPPLFVVGSAGSGELVNYRYRAPYYVVDRLFGAAELRLGGDKAQVVRIGRNDVGPKGGS